MWTESYWLVELEQLPVSWQNIKEKKSQLHILIWNQLKVQSLPLCFCLSSNNKPWHDLSQLCCSLNEQINGQKRVKRVETPNLLYNQQRLTSLKIRNTESLFRAGGKWHGLDHSVTPEISCVSRSGPSGRIPLKKNSDECDKQPSNFFLGTFCFTVAVWGKHGNYNITSRQRFE